MRFLIILLCLFITSCASTVNEVLDGNQVLPPKHGYVLLPVFSNTDIYQIRISGEKYFQLDENNLNSPRKYLLIQLPAGDYSYSEIRLNKYTIMSDFEDGIWDFTIKPGVINYVGHLLVHNNSPFWDAYQLSYVIQNNASIALEYLEKKYPKLIQSYSIVYSGPGEDDFFSFVDSIPVRKGER